MAKLIAELGWNHMGDLAIARKMVSAAKKAGADYVKFQTWKVERLCSGPWDEDGRRQIYEKAELTPEKHSILKEYCDKVGVKFLTSCFCIDDLEFVRRYTNEVKIPSEIRTPRKGEKNIVDEAIKIFDEVYVSTGASNIEEYRKWACYDNVTLMHCVSSYPCDLKNVNFNKMRYLKSLTNKVGYSGHLNSIWDAVVAICYGATIIEKHFTISHDLPGRDNKLALLPSEFAKIKELNDSIALMNTDRGMGIQECENDYRQYQKGRWG